MDWLRPFVQALMLLATALLAAACQPERRDLALGQPLTPPSGAGDPRAQLFETNRYQVSQGGRLFTWYGCGACHAVGATGYRDLGDRLWRYGGSADRIYRSIADGRPGMPAYGGRLPPLVLWQITGYVRTLPKLDPAKRRRQDVDLRGEPQGAQWPGPLR